MSMMNPFPNLQFIPEEDDPTGEANRQIIQRERQRLAAEQARVAEQTRQIQIRQALQTGAVQVDQANPPKAGDILSVNPQTGVVTGTPNPRSVTPTGTGTGGTGTGGSGTTGSTTGELGNNNFTAKSTSREVFRSIISLALGVKANESWIDSLFGVAKKYFDEGTISPTDPFLPDLLLKDADKNPELKPFADRFKGIFALRAKGARFIPSVADYVKAEKDFGAMFRGAGLRDLDNSDFFASLVEAEVDFATASSMVENVFKTIDGADAALKRELQTYFPTLERADLAKALLTGKDGEEELKRKINTAEIKSEATVRNIRARLDVNDLARRGVTRAQAAVGFEQVATELNPLTRLTQIYDRQNAATPDEVQTELESEALLGQQSKRKKRLVEQEAAAFEGRSGTVPTLASRARAGQF